MYGDARYIYMVMCTETKRIYVGRSEKPFRIHHHLLQLRKGKHPIRLMQRDFDEYGEESFSFTLIQNATMEFMAYEYADEYHKIKLRCGKPANSRMSEAEWMDRFNTRNPHFGYNYLDGSAKMPKGVNKKKWVSEQYDFPLEKL